MNEITDKAVRPFDQILREINGGRLVDELTDEMTAVLAAVRENGKNGSITVTLKFTPAGSMNEQIHVVPTVKGSKPEKSRPTSIFFINGDNGLQRDDPYQGDLPGIRDAVVRRQATGTDS